MKTIKSVFSIGTVIISLFAFLISGAMLPFPAEGAGGSCKKASQAVKKYNQFKAKSEYWQNIANCNNISNSKSRKSCLKKARRELKDGLEERGDFFDAQLNVCRNIGKGVYAPTINPGVFTTTIDNQYYPLTPGTTLVYNGETEDGTEHTETTVLTDTVTLMGVTCRVVRDTVSIDGQVVEDTLDYYAQDEDGNVWYFGEESKDYNKKGIIVSIEGSWLSGINGAQPGIIIPGNPKKGDIYRQEYAAGEAEDIGKILSLNETITVSETIYNNCIKTKDYSPLEPDVVENKYYAPNVGVVYEEVVKGGNETVSLVEIKTQ